MEQFLIQNMRKKGLTIYKFGNDKQAISISFQLHQKNRKAIPLKIY